MMLAHLCIFDGDSYLTMETINTPYRYFFDLEKEMKLFSLKEDGIFYWQLVRASLLKGITTKDLHVVSNGTVRRRYSKEVLGTVKESNKMKKAVKGLYNLDVIQIRPCVTIGKDGKLDDHQYDYIDLSDKCRTLDLYCLGAYSEVDQCVKYSMAPAEIGVIFSKILGKLFWNRHISDTDKSVLEEFLKRINNYYGTSFDAQSLNNIIQYEVNCHIQYKKYFLELFKTLNPKLVLEYPHYDDHMFAANAAAKELGIKTVEFQHGRINAHEAYWYEDQDEEGKLLPDFFFVYGKWWQDQIKLPPFCKVVVVGNPYLEKQIELFPKTTNNNRAISVFSNPQNGKALSEFIFGIQDYVIKNNIQILYKLHPNEKDVWKTEYPLLEKMQNVAIIDSGSVYEVLSQSDAAIGINSTVFFEALAYNGIDLYIYTIGDYEGMKPLLESGKARAVTNPEELIEFLEEHRNEISNNAETNERWEYNANINICNAIIDILEDVKQKH